MLARALASPAQGHHHHGPRYFNFPYFCMTCCLEKLAGLVDQNWFERDSYALLLKSLAVGCCCCCCLHIKSRSDLYSVPSNIRTGPTDANAFRGHRLTTQKGTFCEKSKRNKGPRKVNTHAIIGRRKTRKIRLQTVRRRGRHVRQRR